MRLLRRCWRRWRRGWRRAEAMRQFAELLERLVSTRARNGKLRLIADYLRQTPDPDRGWALAALTGALTAAVMWLVLRLVRRRD